MWDEHFIGRDELGLVQGMARFAPDHPTLLMVHGAGGQGAGFLPQLLGLAKRINVAAIDLPGHGRTPGPGLSSVKAYADWLGDFLEAGPLRPVLLGHSLGGAVALTLALERPHLACGLILVNTGSRMAVPPAILEGLERDLPATLHLIARQACAQDAAPGLIERTVAMLSQTPGPVLRGDFASLGGYDVGPRLRGLRLPTLVVAGGEDRMVPLASGQALAEAIDNAQLVVIEGAGHMPFVDNQQEFNQAVLAFVSSLGAPAGAGEAGR